jgi:small-conductance mechanosensitive channel
VIEQFVKRRVLSQYFLIDTNNLQEMSQTDRFKASAVNVLPEIIGLCLFFGVSYSSFFLFEQTNSPIAQLTFLATLITISLIRTVSICSNVLFSPAVPNFRILPLSCTSANRTHRLLVITLGYIISVLMFSAVAHRLGAERQTVLLLQLFFASLLLGVTSLVILVIKNRVKDHILAGDADSDQKEAWGRSQFASVWHILAILYLALLWFLLVGSVTNTEHSDKGAFLLSFFVVPIWMIADRVVQWVVLYAMSTLKIHQSHYEDTEEVDEEIVIARDKGKTLYRQMKNFARTALILAFGIWIAGLWNIEIPFISNLAGVLLDALIIMTLALVFWQFISSWIERKIQESLPEEKEEDKSDGEWGGAASRGRSYTLLPMIRKFIASVLVIMVTMTILSSIGVDIGPLLAGAGVIGLAVGFGAQKLVSDMFSGFFYLLDDAFRVGEYLTAGSVSGTVESITLRNVMLRHHRGMLQIVPHSELGAITNFMRGGMIVKFSLDFPYDANIDKIRKIIKKVGIAMLDDEEIGKDFIRPVKSQGVREITNSVMTIRVKFTAQPGTHFVIRREAYKRITEALSAAGIEYAHKKVIVDVPGLHENSSDSNLSAEQAKSITNAVGAAALATISEEEEKVNKAGEQV